MGSGRNTPRGTPPRCPRPLPCRATAIPCPGRPAQRPRPPQPADQTGSPLTQVPHVYALIGDDRESGQVVPRVADLQAPQAFVHPAALNGPTSWWVEQLWMPDTRLALFD